MSYVVKAREIVLQSLAEKAYKQAPRGKKFRLASGKTSSVVVDASLAMRYGTTFSALKQVIDDMIPDNLEFNVVAGPASGADPLCSGLLELWPELRWCSIRKQAKNHGFDKGLITGPIEKGDRVLLLEDVLTTGRSLGRAVDEVKSAGCIIVGAVVLVDRREFGGRRTIENLIKPAKLKSVFTLAEIRTFRKQHKIS